MFNSKRVIVATIIGVVCGLICWQMAGFKNELPWFIAISIILSRTALGFAIGVSSWKIHWVLHSIIFGIIFSLPMAFSGLAIPEKASLIFWGSIIAGIVYALIIECLTSKVFKSPVDGIK